MKNFNPNYFGAPALEKKYNDNHGPDGRFAGADGGSVAAPSGVRTSEANVNGSIARAYSQTPGNKNGEPLRPTSATQKAQSATKTAFKTGTPGDHLKASVAHREASKIMAHKPSVSAAHTQAASQHYMIANGISK